MSDDVAASPDLLRVELAQVDAELLELGRRYNELSRRRLEIMAALVAPVMSAFGADRASTTPVADGSADRADTPEGVG